MAACVPSCLELLLVTIFSKVRNTTMAEYSTKAMWKYHAGGTSVKEKEKEKEKGVVDEELLRAFRYFDKTGGPAMLHCS